MTEPGFSATVDTSEFDRLLLRLAARAPSVGADAARDAAEVVAGRARGTVPHRSGRLAASVHVEPVDAGAELVASVPYAGWIEFGGTRGRPYVSEGRYFGPAANGAERTMADHAALGLEKAL